MRVIKKKCQENMKKLRNKFISKSVETLKAKPRLTIRKSTRRLESCHYPVERNIAKIRKRIENEKRQ